MLHRFSRDYWVETLHLKPHPEGGFFHETYRSEETLASDMLPSRFKGLRNLGTAIYFMLTAGNFSAFHRLEADEIWHFYDGDWIEVHFIYPSGQYERHLVGIQPEKGAFPQLVIPRHVWFAAQTLGDQAMDGFSLIGCTVAPGFAFEDFELAERQMLMDQFPDHTSLIERFTRETR